MKKYVFLAIAAAAALNLTTVHAQAKEGRTVRVVMHAPLRVIDPIFTNAYITRNHAYLVYDTLFAMDAKGKPHPQMVDSYHVSEDRLTYNFKLRPGLKFHDGSDVTAEDVVASIRRWAPRDVMGKRLLAMTEQMAPVNTTTFSIKLKQPYDLVVETLAKPASPVPVIMPKRIAATPNTTAITEAIGSGPYKFVASEFQPGVKVVYVKNTDYIPRKEPASNFAGGKVAGLDRIEVVHMPDSQTAVNALKKGEIDYIETVAPDLVPQLQGVKGVTAEPKTPVNSMYTLRMNWLQPPFDNVKVRRAALAALHQVDYLDATIGDPKRYKVSGSVFTTASPYRSDEFAPQLKKPDIAKVKQMVKESGYKGEKIVVLHSTDLRSMVNIAPVTAQALRSVGFNVDMQAMDWNTLLQRRARKDPLDKGGWSIFHSYVATIDLMDPIGNANLDGAGDTMPGWSKDPEMEKLRDAYTTEIDAGKRAQLARAIQKRAYDQVFFVPLGETIEYKGYNTEKIGNLEKAQALVFWQAAK